jgi:hypothetical protein
MQLGGLKDGTGSAGEGATDGFGAAIARSAPTIVAGSARL